MRWLLKGYVALVVVVTTTLLAVDISALPSWGHAWSLELAAALLILTVVGEHLQFEVRRGWYTNCSAVPHLAAAFLLPPPVAVLIAAAGAGARALRYPLPPAKLAFNAAGIGLAVSAAAHVDPTWCAWAVPGRIRWPRSSPAPRTTHCRRRWSRWPSHSINGGRSST
jgi:hypothetical protein